MASTRWFVGQGGALRSGVILGILAIGVSTTAIGACVGDDPSTTPGSDDGGNDGSSGDAISTSDGGSGNETSTTDAGPTVVDVSAGFASACALVSDGTVWCWGSDNYGELGVPSASLTAVPTCSTPTACRSTPTQVPGLSNIKQISIGQQSCAVDNIGDVYCWGLNDLGELGHPSGTAGDVPCAPTSAICNPTPSKVAGIADVSKVVVGGNGLTCALTTSHAIYCWGANQTLELAEPDAAILNAPPTLITGFSGKVVTDFDLPLNAPHVCAVVQGEGVYCWGYNANGETGHVPGFGTDTLVNGQNMTPAPAFVAPTVIVTPNIGSADVTQLAAVQGSTCGVTLDASVTCWGNNQYGQFGNASYEPDGGLELFNTPLKSNAANIAHISGRGGSYQASFCAVTNDSHITCWGGTDFGQLGNSQDTLADAAIGYDAGTVCASGTHCADMPQTLAMPLVKTVSLGWTVAAALGTDGKVYAWGQNNVGQLGHTPLTAGDDGACVSPPLGGPGSPCNPRPTVVDGLP